MSWIELIADRKIRDAQEDGAFDNLAGKGRPLDLTKDLGVPAGQRAVFRLMKQAGLLPDWIELDREVRRRRAACEERLKAFRAGTQALTAASRASNPASLDGRRDRFLLWTAQELIAINALVDRLNLVAPTPEQHRRRVDVRERMRELEREFPRGQPYGDGQAAPWDVLLEELRPPIRLSNRVPPRRRD